LTVGANAENQGLKKNFLFLEAKVRFLNENKDRIVVVLCYGAMGWFTVHQTKRNPVKVKSRKIRQNMKTD